ncbi:DUF779 domain-containing protein [uncultured Chryseobacterium sp.]|uniref:DUF779 domain-containing protein n=1 Tax=uncultured Chryseobacterium sp. TaxID=259322 RepID=UPI0026027BB3|nr:DUF779 domain-containing protein [uncultured Chryseobacterium sp.]
MNNTQRLSATPKALELIKELSEEFGDLMFYQAGGCCEGTQPQCFRKGHYYPRTKDVCIGTVLDFYFWVDHDLYEYWKYNHFELDVSDGFGVGGFSLETAKKKTFKINYRVLSKEELENLEEPLLYHQYMILEKEKQSLARS